MQVEINGNPDMGIILQQGYVGHWVDYDYPSGKASTINRVEVVDTKKINDEECYEVEYVSAKPDEVTESPSYWYYTKRADKVYWVRFAHERDSKAIIEDIDDTCPYPTKIEPGMYWHGQETQKNAVTGEVYVSRIRSTKVEPVVELRIGARIHRCLKLLVLGTNADGIGAPTLVEKYINEHGFTIKNFDKESGIIFFLIEKED